MSSNEITKNDKIKFWNALKSGQFASMVKESSRGQKLSNSNDVYNIMKPLFAEHDDVESLYCIFLNAENKIIAIEKMFSGSINCTAIYPREIVKRILALKATSLIMTHNHPSGCTEPSREDRVITMKVGIALSGIDAALHEHIIVGDGYFSMADKGLIKIIRRMMSDNYNTHMTTIKIPEI